MAVSDITVQIQARPPIWFRPALALLVFANRIGYKPSNEFLQSFIDRAGNGIRLYMVSRGKRSRIR